MKVRFLPSAADGLDWFSKYYHEAFPDGDANAKRAYFATKQLLKEHPFAGVRLEGTQFREIQVSRTPFAFIYRVTREEIQIIRVWDNRRQRPRKWT
ncbi:MAG: type II toxin-antitoxin system RelE/ParE family toxin [Pseudomonadota bacterium]